MEIKSLATTGYDTIFRAFEQAFADYELQLDEKGFRAMLTRRGFDPALSFAAFEGDRIAAFTLNGTGTFAGVPTAYDTGTGTLPDYRGKGLATGIFEYCLPFLRSAGLRQYLLEVLQHNDKAVSVYRKLGFEVVREFHYFRQKAAVVVPDVHGGIRPEGDSRPENRGCSFPGPYTVKTVGTARLSDLLSASGTARFWDFTPAWQNSLESISRASGNLVCRGVWNGNRLIGYAVFEPASGDMAQLAVHRSFRRQGIASRLLAEMLAWNRTDAVKVINTDIRCRSVTEFLTARNIPVTGRQYEMIRKL